MVEGLLHTGFLGSRICDGIAVQDVHEETPWGSTSMEGGGRNRTGKKSREPCRPKDSVAAPPVLELEWLIRVVRR